MDSWAAGTLQVQILPRKNLLPDNVANGTENGVVANYWDNNTTETLTSDTTEAWQGTHSVKCVCPGSAAWEGCYVATWATPNVRIPPSQYVTVSGYIKGTVGGTLYLMVSEYTDSGTYITQQLSTLVTLTASWQRVKVTFQTSAVLEQLLFQWGTNTAQAITFYCDGCQIERGSDISAWSIDEGLSKNMLPYNIATGTENGYYTDNVAIAFSENASGTTLSSDTSEYWQGVRSLKTICDGTTDSQGWTHSPWCRVTPFTTYIASIYLKGTAAQHLHLYISDTDGDNNQLGSKITEITPTGTWTRYTVSYRTNKDAVKLFIACVTGVTSTATFYTDGIQVERVNTENLLANVNSGYNVITGTDYLQTTAGFYGSLCTISSSTTYALTGSRSLKAITNNTATGEGPLTYNEATNDIVVTPGDTYTFNVYVYSTGTPTLSAAIYETDINGDDIGYTLAERTLTAGTWTKFTCTRTMTTGVRAYVYVFTTSSVQSTTFYIDELCFIKEPVASDWDVSTYLRLYDWALGTPFIVTDELTQTGIVLVAVQHDTHIDLSWSE